MAAPPRTHPYQPDHSLPPPRRGSSRLCRCGLPRDNRHHEVPDTTEAAAADRRRLGEREEP